MTITHERIELSAIAITTFIVKEMVETYSISTEEALRRFMTTKTYALLKSVESMLWSESAEYVLDMLESEFNNDTENWLKI